MNHLGKGIIWILSWIIMSWSLPSYLHAQNDTMVYAVFDSVVVTGYDSEKALSSVPGAIHVLQERQLTAFDEERILTSMNALPGIRFEQRSPGSYRLAIRGSTLRSPFGVRNVKVYWNGIPFTDPTGSTALNLLDNVNMQQMEIIKGPAGSVYGAGTGGVLNINSTSNHTTKLLSGGVQAGSFGYSKVNIEANLSPRSSTTLEPVNRTTIKMARQSSHGYRDHTNFKRWVGELSGSYQINNQHNLESHLLFSSLDYQIPGGLTRDQFDEDPQLSRQSSKFALGSVEADAGVRQSLWLGGITHRFFSKQFQNKTTIYGSFSPFDNPFNLDYKKDLRTSFGGRTKSDYYFSRTNDRLKASLGGEYQHGFNVARNFENDYGKPGSLNFDDELTANQFLVFARMEYLFADSSFVTVGVSRNFLEYDINRLVDVAQDTAYRVLKSFDPVWIPRIGYSRAGRFFDWHASVSLGYSPPTIEDVRTNEGSINLGLKPEIGFNYEAGIRSRLWRDRISVDLTGYYFNLNNTIVQQSSPRGTVVFENSGSTDQFGVETVVQVVWGRGRAQEPLWHLVMSHALHLFYFDEYSKFSDGELNDFSGNQLTGVPQNSFSGSIRWSPRGPFYVHGMVQAVGEIPLDDANTVYSNSYNDVSIKVGYRFSLSQKATVELFAGVRNALNQKYSLGNDLNAFGGRYYQPAAPRNYYIGGKVGI